jgi:hypothetical protein
LLEKSNKNQKPPFFGAVCKSALRPLIFAVREKPGGPAKPPGERFYFICLKKC